MRPVKRHAWLSLAALLGSLSGVPDIHAQDRGGVMVFAAASLRNAMDELTATFAREQGKRAVVSYAASSALARQIERGAPADIFVSADLEWMDYLEQRRLMDPRSRVTLARNALVLIAPAAATARISVRPGMDWASALDGGRLAVADPTHVPAGRYARAALERLGAWDAVSGRIARADNVRAALALVARAEAPLGIVYLTDAAAEPKVKVLDQFPAALHPPIVYPAALVAGRAGDAAPVLLRYLHSPASRAIWVKHGFDVTGVPSQ